MKHKLNKKIKENKGFTLVEALIAVIILAVVSVLMVQGVSMARKAYASNKIKTEASAIANQEIEKIRSMVFTDIGIKTGDPVGTLDLQNIINGFTVTRSVSWLAGSNNKIKQVKIIVSNSSLVNSIKIVIEISPLEMSVTAGSTTSSSSTSTTVPATTTTVPATTTTTTLLPAPRSLTVVSDLKGTGTAKNRTVKLKWTAPLNPPYGISSYRIYRDGTFLKSVNTLSTSDALYKDYSSKTYYVTVVYSTGQQSGPSNIVTTVPTN